MPKETKVVLCDLKSQQEVITFNESFGYELFQINEKEVVLTRETTNPNYFDIVKFEEEYNNLLKEKEELQTQIKELNKGKKSTKIILYLLLIIPGVIYSIYLSLSKKRTNKFNSDIINKTLEVEKRLSDIIKESRELFYFNKKSA